MRRRQRGSGERGVGGGSAASYGGRGVGCSTVLEGGEEALVTVSRRDAIAV